MNSATTPTTDLHAASVQVLRLLQQGDLVAAERAVSQLRERHGEHPVLSHLAGLALLAQEREGEARPLLEHAAGALREDPVVQANWSLCLQRLGEHQAALEASDRVLSLAPRHAEAHFNRGLLLLALNRFDDAARSFRRAVEIAPSHARAWARLGETEHASGRYFEAELAFRRAIELDPANAALHALMSRLLYDAGLFEQALTAAERALGGDASLAVAWRHRSSALRRLGRLDEAETAIARAIGIDPDDAESLKARGLLRQMQDRLAAAAEDFTASARRRFAPGADVPLTRELRRCSRAKLGHDIEQFAFLASRGVLPPAEAEALIASHRDVARMLPPELADARVVDLPPEALQRLQGSYNRLHHLADAPRLAAGALSPALDGSAIEADYFARGPGITWIDGLLSPQALSMLREYCLRSTFWFDFHHANGYVGAFFEDGFAAPLLLQVAEELRARMPGIFRDHALTQLWAFKYDSRLDGIELHADIAAVNLNFWITPDEANLDAQSGGLVVWDKEAPPDWGFDEYNTSTAEGQARITNFLREAGAGSVRVPHRQNRAVLFNSDLFHRTDRIRFREGYENRRINITMLFGHRGGRIR